MLQHQLFRLIRCVLCAILLLAVPTAFAAQDAGRHQVIEGISIYLGVLPIQMAQNEADELNLPSKVYKEKQRYYVLFAMFDQASGKRIVNASVKARVQALGGLDFSEKELKPIHIEKLISYGNYFHMADPDLYHITLWITRPGSGKPVSGRFDYRRPEK